MRLDQISGWELLALQVVALIVVTPTLWLVGIGFRRSRRARWTSMVVAVIVGGAIAATLLHTDEAAVSSYLFAACLFMFGTVMMAVFLLAAIPRTREAAVGSTLAGVLMLIAFVLTYYFLFISVPVRWLQPTPTAHFNRES